MRILRYDAGQFFEPHYDDSYTRRGDDAGGKERAGEVSFVTCQLYLNEGQEGGATRLLNEQRPSEFIDVVPSIGRVLLFEHHVYHCGATVHKGRKYCLRSDLVFAPVSSNRPAHLQGQAHRASPGPRRGQARYLFHSLNLVPFPYYMIKKLHLSASSSSTAYSSPSACWSSQQTM
jgi:2OG-Fe(II) oxygenase superfamily